MSSFHCGLIGLGVMGQSLARNMASKGFSTLVMNRSPEKTRDFLEKYRSENLDGRLSLPDFMQSLSRPRKIFLMVPAGEAVDEIIDHLLPHLEAGDILIDGGNSQYRDTERSMKKLLSQGVEFVGCGISGGEKGALEGPSLMFGGSEKAWEATKNVLQKIAAKDFSGTPCATLIGPGGSGHFVKMVHNGIEYAFLQMIAESYDLLRKIYGLSSDQISDIFFRWNDQNPSYLFESSALVLKKGTLLDQILDVAEQKGTGKWTVMDALTRGVTLPIISQAVFARIASGDISLRKKFTVPEHTPNASLPLETFVKDLFSAVQSVLFGIFSEGFLLMERASKEEEWNLNLKEIARVWQGGCIIRTRLLNSLLEPSGSEPLSQGLSALREVVSCAIQNEIPAPVFSSTLQSFDMLRSRRLPMNLIAELRDFFGSHGYARRDKAGEFHTDWTAV